MHIFYVKCWKVSNGNRCASTGGPPPSVVNGANFSRIKCWGKIRVALTPGCTQPLPLPKGEGGIHAEPNSFSPWEKAAYMPVPRRGG